MRAVSLIQNLAFSIRALVHLLSQHGWFMQVRARQCHSGADKNDKSDRGGLRLSQLSTFSLVSLQWESGSTQFQEVNQTFSIMVFFKKNALTRD